MQGHRLVNMKYDLRMALCRHSWLIEYLQMTYGIVLSFKNTVLCYNIAWKYLKRRWAVIDS